MNIYFGWRSEFQAICLCLFYYMYVYLAIYQRLVHNLCILFLLQALAQAIKEAKEQHPDMSITRVVVHKETEVTEEDEE